KSRSTTCRLARASFRVNDQNSCDENATGPVRRNVFANDIRLVQNTTTPGNGDEPGYALTIAGERDDQPIAADSDTGGRWRWLLRPPGHLYLALRSAFEAAMSSSAPNMVRNRQVERTSVKPAPSHSSRMRP